MDKSWIENLGPLKALAGIWEGNKGDDIAIDDDRKIENNKFRERLVLEPIGLVGNHSQHLYGLRYSTMAWRLGEDSPFHEEVGYWLWDKDLGHVMRAFNVPRGISVLAGGDATPTAKSFKLVAELGSPTFGICSNPYLDREFKTVRYDLAITILDDHTFTYEEDTQIQIKGRTEIFHHTDKNTLRKVADFS